MVVCDSACHTCCRILCVGCKRNLVEAVNIFPCLHQDPPQVGLTFRERVLFASRPRALGRCKSRVEAPPSLPGRTSDRPRRSKIAVWHWYAVALLVSEKSPSRPRNRQQFDFSVRSLGLDLPCPYHRQIVHSIRACVVVTREFVVLGFLFLVSPVSTGTGIATGMCSSLNCAEFRPLNVRVLSRFARAC